MGAKCINRISIALLLGCSQNGAGTLPYDAAPEAASGELKPEPLQGREKRALVLPDAGMEPGVETLREAPVAEVAGEKPPSGCTKDTECPGGHCALACTGGACTLMPGHGEGEACLASGGTPCAAGLICGMGVCHKPCTGPGACPTGQMCAEGCVGFWCVAVGP